MIKADRYTADGCEELNKAREADVEDRTYQIGEISQKTGLQKIANGWVKPKQGGLSPKDKYKKEYSEKREFERAFGKGTYEERKQKDKENEDFIARMDKLREKNRSGALSSEADSPEARKNYEDFMKEHKKREFQELYGDAIKFDEYGLPSKETIELKNNFLRKEGISDPNKLTNKEFNELAKKIDEQFGINNLERSQELLVAEDAAPRVLTGDTKIKIRK